MSHAQPGRLIIISGPSGAGKSTVVGQLLVDCPLPLQLSVSATTRPPRPGEVDGTDYQFITPDEFTTLQQQDAFLECKEVFGIGHWYGTLRDQVVTSLNQGKWVVLEIDVQVHWPFWPATSSIRLPCLSILVAWKNWNGGSELVEQNPQQRSPAGWKRRPKRCGTCIDTNTKSSMARSKPPSPKSAKS